MHYARKGMVTPEMEFRRYPRESAPRRFVRPDYTSASGPGFRSRDPENHQPEFCPEEVARGAPLFRRASITGVSDDHWRNFLVKINANMALLGDVGIAEEVEKMTGRSAGWRTVMDFPRGSTSRTREWIILTRLSHWHGAITRR